MTRRLQAEDRISKHRIIGPLGAGGMGEVYLAQDETLDRNVALKILPAELVRSEERVRRFVQEAKSASSLNHPNIVTIYEIGHDVLRPADSGNDPESRTVHFISMELVAGKTLATLIHDERTELRTLLGYLAQAAEGLAKAHAAGIVHRDLKPGNIMVSSDGFTKVLDFGLAKLIERRDIESETPNAPTIARDATMEGVVMGTAGYMAPEQVQGKAVDHRADIFAFGCILYEAATRRRPFEAESSLEIMHKILHADPPPVESLNAGVPAELRRLIRRSLAKNPDQRLQSMKDLAIELHEIVEDYDSLSPSSASSTSVSQPALPPIVGRRIPKPIWMLLALVVLGGVAAGVWVLRNGRTEDRTAFQLSRANSLTSRGDVNECVLSRDGRYLGYLTSVSGISSIHVLQVATGSDVEVTTTENAILEGLSFSPEGNYLWYLMRKKDAPNYRSLMQIPSLGGEPRERAFDVDSRITFSPDGARIAFHRGVPQENKDLVVIRDLDTGTEHTIFTVSTPRNLQAVSWSPDGKQLAVIDGGPSANGLSSVISLVSADGGAPKVLSEHRGSRLSAVDWMPDGSAVVVSGEDIAISVTSQIQLITVPRGAKKPLTNDLSEYEGVSVAADGTIAATRQLRFGDLWVADIDGGQVHPALSVSNPERAPYEIICIDNENIHYAGAHEGEVHFFSVPLLGGEPRLLTSPGVLVIRLDGYVGGALMVMIDRQELIPHIWKINPDGSGLRQITQGAGESTVDVTQDGRFMVYTRADSSGLWFASTEGGPPHLVGGDPRIRFGGQFSPDGRFLEAEDLVLQDNLMRPGIHIFSVPELAEVRKLSGLKNIRSPQWTHDSKSFYFLDMTDPHWNIFISPSFSHTPTQESKPVTHFTEGRIQNYAVAPDGRHLAMSLRTGENENVWVAGPDGSGARQITQFTAKTVLNLVWTPDGRKLAIYAGQMGRDAVILKPSAGA